MISFWYQLREVSTTLESRFRSILYFINRKVTNNHPQYGETERDKKNHFNRAYEQRNCMVLYYVLVFPSNVMSKTKPSGRNIRRKRIIESRSGTRKCLGKQFHRKTKNQSGIYRVVFGAFEKTRKITDGLFFCSAFFFKPPVYTLWLIFLHAWMMNQFERDYWPGRRKYQEIKPFSFFMHHFEIIFEEKLTSFTSSIT